MLKIFYKSKATQQNSLFLKPLKLGTYLFLNKHQTNNDDNYYQIVHYLHANKLKNQSRF